MYDTFQNSNGIRVYLFIYSMKMGHSVTFEISTIKKTEQMVNFLT